jgi:hypothetical protein
MSREWRDYVIPSEGTAVLTEEGRGRLNQSHTSQKQNIVALIEERH